MFYKLALIDKSDGSFEWIGSCGVETDARVLAREKILEHYPEQEPPWADIHQPVHANQMLIGQYMAPGRYTVSIMGCA